MRKITMKNIAQMAIFIFLSTINHLYAQNISTGVTNSGAAIASGPSSVDPNWRVVSGPGITIPVNAKIANYITTAWQATPISGTNAGWINSTGDSCSNNAGRFTFERSFTISSSIITFTASLQVAFDDTLVSLQLINPAGTTISLGGTGVSQYFLGAPINYTQSSPMSGTWKIRAVLAIRNDAPPGKACGGFLLSGNITTSCNPPCVCDDLRPDFVISQSDRCTWTFTNTTQIPCCMTKPFYGWFVNGAFINLGPTLTYSFPVNGTYTVCMGMAVTMPDGTSCVKQICKTVVVEGCCNCDDLQPSFETVKLDRCDGTFESTTDIPPCMKEAGGETYEWTVNGNFAGTGSTLNYTFPGNGIYTICLKITAPIPGGGQCVKERCHEVEVRDCFPCNCESVKPNIDYNLENCDITLVGNASLPPCLEGATVAYNWYVNSTYAGLGSPFTYTFPGNGIYNICLNVGVVFPDGTKCSRDTCIQVIVNNCGECRCNEVTPSFTYTVSDCIGHFVNTSTIPDCIQHTIKWFVDSVLVGTGNTFNYPFPGSGTYSVCMRVVGLMPGGAPCKPTACKNITVDCGPCNCYDLNPDFNSEINMCHGTFTSKTKPPSCLTNIIYEWFVDSLPVGTGTTLNYTFPSTGVHIVCLKVTGTLPYGQGPCTNQTCYYANAWEACPDPCKCENIYNDFSVGAVLCDGTFDASVSSAPACLENLVYRWYVGIAGGGTVSPVGTGITFNYTFPGSGSYTVCFMISGYLPDGTYCEKMQCRDIDVNCINFIEQPEMGNNPQLDKKVFTLYPNPANDHLTIEMQFDKATEVQIIMRSTDGKELLNENRKAESGLQRFELKVPASVANSMVFIEVITNDGKVTRMVNISKQ